MRNKTLFSVVLLLFCTFHNLAAMDREIVLGREDGWSDFPQRFNLILKPGKWDSKDLFLQEHEYGVDEKTDLLLHFNEKPLMDDAGLYTPVQEDVLLSERFHVLGAASAVFSSARSGVAMQPSPRSLFTPGEFWQDFSIEFWLYPALLDDGETLFFWSGSRWQEDRAVPQRIAVRVKERTLVWIFDNFFASLAEKTNRFELRGITPLIPRTWHHHLIRYDSKYGLFEYLLDGVPEAVIYTTANGHVDGSLYSPQVGDADSGPVRIGADFTGFIDELRITRRFEENPVLNRYRNVSGHAVSRIFDLGYTGTALKRIEAVSKKPADTEIYFYYRIADQLETSEQLATAWRQFVPGLSFDNIRGRFLQIMFELLPDGATEKSPELSEIRIVYEQDLPPPPPPELYVEPGDRMVTLYWQKVSADDVRGYLIYYGNRPGSYHTTIDVGDVAGYEVTGLENGRLYYFSLVAYDSTEPPHRSLFSTEISTRPSGLLK